MRVPIQQLVTRRLVVVFGSERLSEHAFRDQIVSHKKGIDAQNVAANQTVGQGSTEFLKRFQACPEILCAIPKLRFLEIIGPFQTR